MKKFIPVSIIGVGFLVAFFAISVGPVHGISMQPNVFDGYYLQDYLSYLFRGPARGEIVVLKSPVDDRMFVKRVVGLPGEKVVIEGGSITVYSDSEPEGKKIDESYLLYSWIGGFTCHSPYTLGPNEYFVLGDNRGHSFDSRAFGPIGEESIVARLVARL